MSISIGPYHVGEIPPRLIVTFKDSTGVAIPLSGYTAKFTYRKYGGAWVTVAATVDADQVNNKGQVYYDWVAGDFITSGDFEGGMWVGNATTQRYDSVHLDWQVIPAVVPTPVI